MPTGSTKHVVAEQEPLSLPVAAIHCDFHAWSLDVNGSKYPFLIGTLSSLSVSSLHLLLYSRWQSMRIIP